MDDSADPATKADINELRSSVERVEASQTVLNAYVERTEKAVERLAASVEKFSQSVQQRFDLNDRRFDNVDEDIDKILVLVGNIDARLQPSIGDHERRIKRLERRVGISA